MSLRDSIYIIESQIGPGNITLTPSRTKPTFIPVLGELASGVEITRWHVIPFGPGSDLYTITVAGQDGNGLVAKDNELFIAPTGVEGPTQFSITAAGEGIVHVNIPSHDLVWTLPEPGAQVTVKPANGSPNQLWRFVELPRD